LLAGAGAEAHKHNRNGTRWWKAPEKAESNFYGLISSRNGVYVWLARGATMPSHSDVAKRIFDDAKQQISQHENAAQWDLLTGLSELCLAVVSLEVEVGQLKAEIKKLQQ